MWFSTTVLAALAAASVSGYTLKFPQENPRLVRRSCQRPPPFDFSAWQTDANGRLRGSLKITEVDNLAIGEVSLGGKTLKFLFDSGSTTDWVLGPTIADSIKPASQRYDPVESYYAQPADGYFCQPYVNGDEVSGSLVSELITIGGVDGPGSTLGVASTASDTFSQQPFSGILGLAPPGLTGFQPNQPTWFFRILQNLQEPVFATALKINGTGTMDIGYIDSKKFSGQLHYVPTQEQFSWTLTSGGIKVGNGPFIRSSQKSYIDSGDPGIQLTKSLVSLYYASVVGSQSIGGQYSVWIFPCGTSLPDLSIELGSGYFAKVPGKLLALGPSPNATGYCEGAVQEANPGGPQGFGAPFYSSQFIVHDGLNLQMGFANLK